MSTTQQTINDKLRAGIPLNHDESKAWHAQFKKESDEFDEYIKSIGYSVKEGH